MTRSLSTFNFFLFIENDTKVRKFQNIIWKADNALLLLSRYQLRRQHRLLLFYSDIDTAYLIIWVIRREGSCEVQKRQHSADAFAEKISHRTPASSQTRRSVTQQISVYKSLKVRLKVIKIARSGSDTCCEAGAGIKLDTKN